MHPYLFLPVSIIVLTLYLYTWFAVRTGMIMSPIHRKFWNIALLATFLITALLGILLTIQINYKLNLPHFQSIIRYHVNFGIAMAIVGLFHVGWHLSYYLPNLHARKKATESPKPAFNFTPDHVKTIVFILGISTSMIQVVFLRLFLSIYYGNELIVGVFLAVWMSLTGFGAWMGKKQPRTLLQNGTLLLSYSIFAFLAGIAMSLVKALFFPAGLLINPWQLMLTLILLLMPVCICSGFVFRSMSTLYPAQGASLYASETAGSVIGGMVITFSVLLYLDPIASLSLVLGLNVAATAFILYRKRPVRIALLLLSLALPCMVILSNVDSMCKSVLFPNQTLLESHDTPYGSVTVTDYAGQTNLFLNMQNVINDVECNEEIVHFTALQHPKVEKVLLVSGSYSGIVPEFLKYAHLKEFTYIEPNTWLLKYTEKYFPRLDDKRIKLIQEDPRWFLLSDTSHYDVIVMDVPAPSTLQLNRYFSIDFMNLLKKHATPHTIVGYSLTSSGSYLSNENAQLHSILKNTMGNAFQHNLIVPGSRNYFISSDQPLSFNYDSLFYLRNIETLYVNPYYLDIQLLHTQSKSIESRLDIQAPVNTDLNPVALWAQTINFFSLLNVNSMVLLGGLTLLLLLPVFRFNLVSHSVFITGLTASSLEMLILFAFQMIFGYLYAASGIIFAIFMTGLSLGARQRPKWGVSHLYQTQTAMLCITILVCLFVWIIDQINSVILLYSVVSLLTFIPAWLTGFQFALALSKLPGHDDSKTSYLYGVDLLGSALGLLLVSTLLIPAFGFAFAFLTLMFINALCTLILYFFKR